MHSYIPALLAGCCRECLLGTSSEGEPTFCYSPAELEAIFWEDEIMNLLTDPGRTDMEVEVVFYMSLILWIIRVTTNLELTRILQTVLNKGNRFAFVTTSVDI